MRRGLLAGAVGAGILAASTFFIQSPTSSPPVGAVQQLDAKTLDAIGRLVDGNGAARWPSHTADPFTCGSGEAGAFYYDSTANQFKGCNGTAWGQIGGGGGGAGEIKRLAVTQNTTSTSLVNANDIFWSVAASTTYYGHLVLIYDTASTGEGFRYALNCPASPTSVLIVAQNDTNAGGSVQAGGQQTACDTVIITNGTGPGAGDARVWIWFEIVNGASAGEIRLRIASESVAGSNLIAGSYGVMYTVTP